MLNAPIRLICTTLANVAVSAGGSLLPNTFSAGATPAQLIEPMQRTECACGRLDRRARPLVSSAMSVTNEARRRAELGGERLHRLAGSYRQ
jgi:hypothetical protein